MAPGKSTSTSAGDRKSPPLRVVVWWEYFSGYMSACWGELAASPGIDLFVIAKGPSLETTYFALNPECLGKVRGAVLPAKEVMDVETVARLIGSPAPDVLLCAGWINPAFLPLISRPQFAQTKLVLALDTPGDLWSWRHLAIRLQSRAFFSRVDMVFVPGERARQFALLVGFPENTIRMGLYGCDAEAFGKAIEMRQGWPRRFLFVGRLEDYKGISTLLKAYEKYRAASASPWELTVCGTGPLRDALDGRPGVTATGFVPPDGLVPIFANSGAFVLPSWYEPWGLVVAEAAAAGLPIVATNRCGATAELVRDYYNGRTVPAGEAGALAEAMKWIESNYSELPTLGSRSRDLVRPYSARVVGQRWAKLFEEIAGEAA